jgi:VWFA-related protein
MPSGPAWLSTGLAAAAGLGLVVGTDVAGQQPIFHADTAVVPIYATVQDSRHRAVTNLTAADFLIRIDGREQPIVSFSNEPQPFSAVILVDYSASMSGHRSAVRAATADFIARLLPGDRVRLGGFSNQIVLAPDAFTADKHALADALRWQVSHVDAGGASPVWRAALQSLDALHAESLRRVLVLLSDGHDAPARGQGGVDFDDVAGRVRDGNVLVYALGFVNRRPPRSYNEPAAVSGPHRGLEVLVDRSAGMYFEVDQSPEFDRMFRAIIDDLHSQYLIGVPVEARDGRRHRLDVRVHRPGLNVRAPGSFVARP